MTKQSKTKPSKMKFPEYGQEVRATLQHFYSKGIVYADLIYVYEDDCNWMTADDNSELSHDWDVIEWEEI